jgi:hypothetical protein
LAIDNNFCSESHRNNFIFPENITTSIVAHIFDHNSKDTFTFDYPINKTGFYCVVTYLLEENGQYFINVEWQNPYGELPASEYPKLPVSVF